MHIGIITSEFPPDIGGVETYAFEYSKALVEFGHKVSILVHKNHPIEASLPNITIYPALKFIRRIDRKTLLGFKVDAWHVMNAAHSWLTLETDKPVVVSIHGNDFLNPYPLTGNPTFSEWGSLWRLSKYLKPLDIWLGKHLTLRHMRQALPRASIILANSKYTEGVFLAKFPACCGKTRVAKVGVSQDFINTQLSKVKNSIPHLLTVSRLSEMRKNVDKVIESLGLLKETANFKYTVIGDGYIKPQLESLVKKHGLADKVFFVGRQSLHGVIDAMMNADLFILPSSTLADSHEGFGIVYLEAAACGTPSLATRQAGAVEAIEDGISGFFVEEPTVENIYQTLVQFLSGEHQFAPSECRKFAEQFTWNKVVEKALPFYLPGQKR